MNACLHRATIGLAFAALPAVTAAQSSPAWTFELTPYLWAAGIGGDASLPGLPPVSVSRSFADILDSLRVGAMAAFEARSGSFGVLLDAFYVRLENAFTTPGPALGSVEGRVDQQLLSAAVSWRVLDAGTRIDLLAGVRRTDQRIALDATPGVLPGGARSESLGWTDGIVGVRAHTSFTADWTGMAYLDVGGSNASTTTQAIVGLERRLSDRWGARFGYRYLRSDYERGASRFTMTTQGVYLGAGYRF